MEYFEISYLLSLLNINYSERSHEYDGVIKSIFYIKEEDYNNNAKMLSCFQPCLYLICGYRFIVFDEVPLEGLKQDRLRVKIKEVRDLLAK